MGNAAVDFSGKPFHFIGIGGIGMSAIAHILAEKKFPVSGSDLNLNHITHRLSEQGVRVFMQQDESNLSTFLAEQSESPPSASHPSASHHSQSLLPQVICSTAIDPSNIEYRAAVNLGCPIFHRSDVLAALMEDYSSIAVGGTHGKTTTSSLIAYLLLKAGLDPTIVVGGEVDAWDGNARLGQGDYLVAEADESDGSLVKFKPHIGIVTNIELDHPDHYKSLDDVIDIFQAFRRQSTIFVGNLDCPTLREIFDVDISYALDASTGADYTVDNLAFCSTHTSATVYERGECLGTLTLRLLGQHNLSNALAAVAVGRYLGLQFQTIASILATFEGAHRRFEQRGYYSGITFLDDYAHHPSEIKATLAAAQTQASVLESGDRKRIVAVFQPHRYSRTASFLDDFAQSFQAADLVVISDIYSAGEENTYGISGQTVAEAIAQYQSAVTYQATLAAVESFLKDTLQSGDLVLFLGAGNLNKVIPDLLDFYRQKQDQVLQSSI
ncbi:MAG: UDP-N-acetylmuramate--L-alanine ligase [Leptolyngbyaceae bacterium]|nr:UDP-N-acetylmuramate--L-alanine ligase [Leptolyngbyaceae bacterium]